MLEEWAEKILDNSFVAKALRKSAAKSILLGCMDALQNPNGVMEEIAKKEPGLVPKVEVAPHPEAQVPPPAIALPRAGLIGLPNPSRHDAPDQPSVPPARVRKNRQKKTQTPNAGTEVTPPALGAVTNGGDHEPNT